MDLKRLLRLRATPDASIPDNETRPTLFLQRVSDAAGLTRANPVVRLPADEIAAHGFYAGLSGLSDALRREAGGADGVRRILFLVHGYEYDPRLNGGGADPFYAIFREGPPYLGRYAPVTNEHETHQTPWLKRLSPDEGDLVVCFAYASNPGGRHDLETATGLPAWCLRLWHERLKQGRWGAEKVNLFGYAYFQADLWAEGLAGAIIAAADLAGPDVKIDIMCHSLGARVATSALTRLARRFPANDAISRIDRVLMLAGAAAWPEVRRMRRAIIDANAVHRRAADIQFFNITSAYDAVLRLAGGPLVRYATAALAKDHRRFLVPPVMEGLFAPTPMIGVDGGAGAAAGLRWCDIQLDLKETREWGERAEMDLIGDLKSCRLDHWVHYTHPGNWALYDALLNDKGRWTAEAIRSGVTLRSGARLPPHSGRILHRGPLVLT